MDRVMRRQRLAELDTQRKALERRVEEVEAQRAELHRLLRENERSRAVFAPVHMLPDDVLKLVFEAAYEHPLNEDCSSSESPLVVTHVSRRWRQVALSLPRLWRCIHVGPSTQLLEHYLKCSGSLTLSLFCFGPDDLKNQPWRPAPSSMDSESRHKLYVQQLTQVLGYASRLTHIAMAITSHRLMEVILPIMQRASFPLLEGLGLINGTDDPLPETARFSLDCPRLKRLDSFHMHIPFFPLAALEHLELYRPSLEISLQTLCALAEAAPRLKNLKINWTEPDPRSEGNAAHFPHLDTLAIVDCHYPERILDCIDAPKLSTLTLDDCLLSQPPVPSERRAIRAFAAVHTLRLRQLCIERLGPGSAGPLPVFQYTPAIKVLELGRWCDLHMTAVVVHLSSMKPMPFRSLRTLSVAGRAIKVFAHLSKILIESRQAESPLLELSLSERMRENLGVEQTKLLGSFAHITPFSPEREPGDDPDADGDGECSRCSAEE